MNATSELPPLLQDRRFVRLLEEATGRKEVYPATAMKFGIPAASYLLARGEFLRNLDQFGEIWVHFEEVEDPGPNFGNPLEFSPIYRITDESRPRVAELLEAAAAERAENRSKLLDYLKGGLPIYGNLARHLGIKRLEQTVQELEQEGFEFEVEGDPSGRGGYMGVFPKNSLRIEGV